MGEGNETTVSTDALMNRQRVDQEWVSMYEGQVNSQDVRLKGLEAQGGQIIELQSEVEFIAGECRRNGQERKSSGSVRAGSGQLRRQAQTSNSRPSAPGPVAAARNLGCAPIPGICCGGAAAHSPRE